MANDPTLTKVLLCWEEAKIDGEQVSIAGLCNGRAGLLAESRCRIENLEAMDALLDIATDWHEARTIDRPDEEALGCSLGRNGRTRDTRS